jgi:hypothetical protein
MVKRIGLANEPESPEDEERAQALAAYFAPLPLPAQAVGVGGRWSTVRPAAEAGGAVETTTYTMKARDGRRVELAIEVTQAASQPDTPSNITELMNGKGSAQLMLHLPVAAVALLQSAQGKTGSLGATTAARHILPVPPLQEQEAKDRSEAAFEQYLKHRAR